jgi:hypothetical protein
MVLFLPVGFLQIASRGVGMAALAEAGPAHRRFSRAIGRRRNYS